MPRRLLLASPLALVFAASPGFADPATPEGAKKILDLYSQYFTPKVVEGGFLTVKPDGDEYVVTWDFQKAVEQAGAERSAVSIEPLVYRVAIKGDHAWSLHAERLPRITIKDLQGPDRGGVALEFLNAKVVSDYDDTKPDFLHSVASYDKLQLTVDVPNGGAQTGYRLEENGGQFDLEAKASDDGQGVDVTVGRSMQSVNQTMSVQGGGSGAPINVHYNTGPVTTTLQIDSLQGRAIGDLWRYVVANISSSEEPPELRDHVKATLPVWTNLRLDGAVQDVAIDFALAQASLKSASEHLALSGFTPKNVAEFAIKLDEVTAQSLMLPAWANDLSPLSIDVGLSAGFDGLDRIASIAIDDPRFGDGDLSPQSQAGIETIWKTGHPTLTLEPSSLKNPIIDLRLEGSAKIDAKPSGHLHVSVDSLDKTVSLLQEASKEEPDLANIVMGMTYVKGLAKSDAEGRLVWDIDASESKLVVNGTPIPLR